MGGFCRLWVGFAGCGRGLQAVGGVYRLCVQYLQVEPPAAGEGNCTGLQTGVGLGAVEVLVMGPVQVRLDPTALQLEQS